MNITVLYVGSSLLGPLKDAEREINRVHKLHLRIAAYNFGSPLNEAEWTEVDDDLRIADIVFVIHVMDGENASRLLSALGQYKSQHSAVVVINCMTAYNDVRFGLLGGSIVDSNALLRSYIWHCIGIPLVASIFMAVHFWRIRKDGGISGPAPVMLESEIKAVKKK